MSMSKFRNEGFFVQLLIITNNLNAEKKGSNNSEEGGEGCDYYSRVEKAREKVCNNTTNTTNADEMR